MKPKPEAKGMKFGIVVTDGFKKAHLQKGGGGNKGRLHPQISPDGFN